MEDPFDLACKRMKLICEDVSNPTERKWEELPNNCITLIFQKIGIKALTLAVPFVCKSWYEASRDPACWKVIDLRETDLHLHNSSFAEGFKLAYHVNSFTLRGFLEFLIRRSNKSATKLFTGEVHLSLTDAILLLEEYPELDIISEGIQLSLREYLLKIDSVLGRENGKRR